MVQSLDETLKLLEFIESEVRKSAVEAVTEFTIAYFKVIDNILTNLIPEDRYWVEMDIKLIKLRYDGKSYHELF